jgi:hypothetical protein
VTLKLGFVLPFRVFAAVTTAMAATRWLFYTSSVLCFSLASAFVLDLESPLHEVFSDVREPVREGSKEHSHHKNLLLPAFVALSPPELG